MRTGVANLASMENGLRKAGALPITNNDPGAIRDAAAVVLPGVGAFAAGMEALAAGGLDRALCDRIAAGRPTFAVCLGLQLLFEASEEGPGVRGLGIVPGAATRFPASVRVPQFGWNRVLPSATSMLLQSGYAYFANSYRVTSPPPGWAAATSDHGGAFVAAIERGDVVACQFHPELSGPWGIALLRRWIARAIGDAASAEIAERGAPAC